MHANLENSVRPFMTLAEITQTRQAEEAENKVKIKENKKVRFASEDSSIYQMTSPGRSDCSNDSLYN